MMRRLLDIGFLVLIALSCAGLDFYIQRRDHGGAGFGLAEYIALRKGGMNDLLYPPSLAGALPSAVEGWEMAAAKADMVVSGSPEFRADQASEVALVKAVAALEKASHPAGDMRGLTMTKDDTRLRMVATLRDMGDEKAAPAANTGAGIPDSAETIQTAANLKTMLQTAPPAAFSVVDGVAFDELPVAAIGGDPSLRMMRAQLGDQLSVTVVTKSTDDAAIKAAMQAIDFVMLNKLLNTPVAGVADGQASDLRFDPPSAAITASGEGQTGTAPPVALAGSVAIVPKVAAPNVIESTSQPAQTAKKREFVTQSDPAQAPPETAVFVPAPQGSGGQGGQPCVRRAGILVCPDS